MTLLKPTATPVLEEGETIRPHKLGVIVEIDAPEEMVGEIIIPNRAQGHIPRGYVRAIGNDCDLVEVGDRVLFAKTAIHQELEMSERHYLIQEYEILAVLEGDE